MMVVCVLVRDRIYMIYRDRLQDVRDLSHHGFVWFIESKRYLKVRKKYLEFVATLPNKTLDARVNQLLNINYNQEEKNNQMKNKERSPRKEKKKKKKPK